VLKRCYYHSFPLKIKRRHSFIYLFMKVSFIHVVFYLLWTSIILNILFKSAKRCYYHSFPLKIKRRHSFIYLFMKVSFIHVVFYLLWTSIFLNILFKSANTCAWVVFKIGQLPHLPDPWVFGKSRVACTGKKIYTQGVGWKRTWPGNGPDKHRFRSGVEVALGPNSSSNSSPA